MDIRTVTTGAKIKTEAAHQNLSAHQLSERTGLGYPTVEGILAGTREPKLTHLYLLADALNIPVADLIVADVEAQPGRVAS